MNPTSFLLKTIFIFLVISPIAFTLLFSQPQTKTSSFDDYPYSLYQVPFLFDLNKEWETSSGIRISVPFSLPSESQPLTISHLFEWTSELPDTFYIYIEGVAWEATLKLNDRFISISPSPFKPWIIPVSRTWLSDSPATISITLSSGTSRVNHPTPFLGIVHGIYLMNKEQLSHIQSWELDRIKRADSVVCWAPYFRDTPIFNDTVAIYQLMHILTHTSRNVYFPFPAGKRQKMLCRQFGLVEVENIFPDTYVAMLNQYPAEKRSLDLHNKFWLDKKGKRTSYYGEFFKYSKAFHFALDQKPWLGLVLTILFPLISLLLIKLTNPNFFYSMHRLFLKPDVFLDTVNDIIAGNPGFLILLIIIKIFLYSILISLGVYFIDWANLWENINLLNKKSLLINIFYGAKSYSTIFLRALIIVSIWQTVKYSVMALLGSIFNIRNLSVGVFNMDIVSVFPYLMVLEIPLITAIFVQSGYALPAILMLAGLAFFLFRQVYVIYLGLERLFSFSLGVKILYICAFKVLPYIIWF